MIERINPFEFDSFGQYSQAVKIDLGTRIMILTAGQIALDDEGHPVAPGNIEAQAHYIFDRLRQVLEAAGAGLEDVVKAQFFLTDMSKYDQLSSVRDEYFAAARPASTMVEISQTVAAGCELEIEVMAIIETIKE